MAEKLYKYREIYWLKFDEGTVRTELKGDHPGVIISTIDIMKKVIAWLLCLDKEIFLMGIFTLARAC